MKKEKKRVGFPTLYKKAMKRHNIHLSEEHIKIAIALGGEISAGIRLALETIGKERGLTQPAPDAWESADLEGESTPEVLSTSQTLSTPTKRR